MQQHAHRPTVADDVMNRHEQHVLTRAALGQAATDEGPTPKIERLPRFFRGQVLYRPLSLRRCQSANVLSLELQFDAVREDLQRTPFFQFEGRAEHFVTSYDFVERAFERGDVQRTQQSHRRLNIVSGVTGSQLVKEPESLL